MAIFAALQQSILLKQNHLQIYIIFLLIVHLMVLFFSVYQGHHLLKDSEEYLVQRQNLAEHDSWYAGKWQEEKRPELYSRRPPGYAVFLYLTGTTVLRPLPMLLLQTLLSFLVFLSLGLLIHHYNLSLYPLMVGSLLFPSQLIYTQFIMSEILFQAFIWGGFLCFWLWRQQEKFWQYLLFHLAFALSVAIKPVMIYFWIFTLAFSILLVIKLKSPALLAPAFFPLLVIGFISWINFNNTGFYHFSSIKHSNMVSYNAYHVLIKTEGEQRAEVITDSLISESELLSNYAEKAKYLERKGLEIIMKNPVDYAKFHLKGMMNFFLDPGRFDIQTFLKGEKRDEPGMFYYFNREGYSGIFSYLQQLPWWKSILLLLIVLWSIILIIALFFFVFQDMPDDWMKWLLIITVFYICFLTGPVGAARFKVPVYPLLLFTLPFLFQSIKYRLQK